MIRNKNSAWPYLRDLILTCPYCMQVRSEVGDVTVLVNNAGIVTGKKFYDIPDHMAELTFQVNTIAHLWVRMLILPAIHWE